MTHLNPHALRRLFVQYAAAAALLAACGSQAPLGARLIVEPPPPDVRQAQNTQWLETIRTVGKPGHWLVIRGYGDSNNFIVMMTNIPLSHAAVLDLENDQVVESIAEGVILTPLEKFVDHAHRILIIEPRWWDEALGLAAATEARSLAGSKYDFTGLVGLSDDQRFYCSELAFHVYRAQQTDRDHIPKVIEPGQMYLWGKIVWDSGTRD